MTFWTDTHSARPSIFSSVMSALRNLGSSIDLAASTNARMRQIERLEALSDAQLTAKGLRRDEIVRYVLRDVISI